MSKSAILLCGGRSRRMGRAKALMPWRGRLLIEHLCSVLRGVVSEIVVVNSGELELPSSIVDEFSATIVQDREPGLGPLGGIREGLHAITHARAYATSIDAPFLDSAFVQYMFEHGDCAAPNVNGFTEPLASVYPKRLAETADALIADKKMRPLFLLQAGNFVELNEQDLPSTAPLRNLNDPKSYLQALADDGQDGEVLVEFYGMARQHADCEKLSCKQGLMSSVLQEIEQQTGMKLSRDQKLAPEYLFSLDGRQFLQTLDLPLAAGEKLVVMDAAVGG